jgi:hypothetical protein
MKVTRLLKEEVMLAVMPNDVQKNRVIRATSVPNAMLDCASPTASNISIPYRIFNVIWYKPVKLDQN